MSSFARLTALSRAVQSVLSPRIRTVLLSAMLFGAILPSAHAQLTLAPVGDAYVQNGGSSATNFGTNTSLLVKNDSSSGNTRVAYLKFDFSSVTGAINGATLRLYGSAGTGSTGDVDTVSAVPATPIWVEAGEGSITWNNRPALGSAITTANISTTKQYYTWNVLSAVAAAQAAGQTQISLAVTMNSPTTNADTFNARENAANQPQLVVTVQPPSAPTNLTATAGNNKVTLNWSTAAGASGYGIYRSMTTGGPYTLLNTSTGTSYVDTTGTVGYTYYYVVASSSSGTYSTYSNQASAASLPPAPAAPTNLSIAASNGQLLLSWTASSTAISYNIYRALASGGEGLTPYASTTSTSYADGAVTNGTPYYYKVTAVNTGGESAPTPEATGTPVAPFNSNPSQSLPAAADSYVQNGSSANTNYGTATTLLVKNDSSSGNTRVTYLSFNLSSITGTITGASLELYGGTGSGTTGDTDTAWSVATTPAWTETGITYNNRPALLSALNTAAISSTKQYYIWNVSSAVAAAQSGGQSTVSIGITMNSPTGNPDTFNSKENTANNPKLILSVQTPVAPTTLTATAGTSQVVLNWQPVSGVLGYVAYRALQTGGPYTQLGLTTSTTYTDTGVTPGTTYYYVVAASNSGGAGTYSNEANATPIPAIPAAPLNVNITMGPSQIQLSWNASATAVSYNIYRSTTPGGEGSTPLVNVTSSPYTDSTVTNGTTYYYQITAVNLGGESLKSVEVSATPEPAPPAAPSNVTATASIDQVTVSWTAVPLATGYIVYRSASLAGPFKLVSTQTATTYLDDNIVPGTQYFYVVAATDGGGTGAQSTPPVTGTPLPPAPRTPDSVSIAAGSTQITLSWTLSGSATSYNIYRSLSPHGEGSTPYVTGNPTTSFTDTGLTNGVPYYYEITAVNAGGESAPTNEISATPEPTPPSPPSQISVIGGNQSVSLVWYPVPGANTYNVKRSFASEGPYVTIATTFLPKYTDTSLTNGVSYYYVISSLNTGGEGANSFDVYATPGLSSNVTPTQDSYVQSGAYATTNFGTLQQLVTKYAPTEPSNGRISFLTFNASQFNGLTGTIYLELLGKNLGNAYNATDSVYSVASTSWSASTITWNNMPAIGSKLASTSIGVISQYNKWDVTSYVQAQLAAGKSLVSFAVQMDASPSTDEGNVYSSDRGHYPPVLSLTINPPGPASNLTAAVTLGSPQIVLNWTASAGATSYNVKRSTTTGGPYTTVGSSTTTTYTDNSLVTSTVYYYIVTAVSAGGESLPTNEANAVLPNVFNGSDLADTYVQVGNATTNYGTLTTMLCKYDTGNNLRFSVLKFSLSGMQGQVGAVKLELYGRNGGTGYSAPDTAYGMSNTSWTETGLTYATMPTIGAAISTATITSKAQYNIWDVTSYVNAALAAGQSQLSFVVKMNGTPTGGQSDTFTTKEGASNPPKLVVTLVPPGQPTTLTANAILGTGQVVLSWTAASNATGYNVLRGTVSGGPYTQIAQTANTTYTDTPSPSGVPYYYVVVATNPGGQSAASNEASATPLLSALTSFAVNPNTVIGGAAAALTIALNGPAPTGGAIITLTSTDSAISLPTSVTIPAGSTSDVININTSAVTTPTFATFTGTYSGTTLYSTLTLNPPPPPVSVQITFRPATSSVPSGWTADTGQLYSLGQGFGWISAVSAASGADTPMDMTPNTVDRKRTGLANPLDSTLIEMQYPASYNTPGLVTTPGAWLYALPNGTYSVNVSVGDAINSVTNTYDSQNSINVNGVPLISSFQGTASNEYTTGKASITVTNGLLEVDANGGTNTKMNWITISNTGVVQLANPVITSTNPSDQATGVDRGVGISLQTADPNQGAGVDPTTLTATNIYLLQTNDSALVPGKTNTDAAGDDIVFQPNDQLQPDTNYTLVMTSGVKDTLGALFIPYTFTFTTGETSAVPPDPQVQFTWTTVYNGDGSGNVKFGPDHKLYATFLNGNIARWTLDSAGNLTNEELFQGFAGRAVIGLAFDPNNSNLLWVVNDDPVFPEPANDFTGKISKLLLTPGTFTGTIQDYVVGLPRSAKDHMTNNLAFGPDGFLYCTQAADTAEGAPDADWDNRSEHMLSSDILRIDTTQLANLPINVQTDPYNGTTGTYNPFASGAPVTIYACGLRNSYDLIWHSNGFLYCPTNGSSAGGAAPASPPGVTPVVPGLVNGPAEDDYLYKVLPNPSVQGGYYYGHPNPTLGHYVLDRGNPDGGANPADIVTGDGYTGYPIGVQPDVDWGGYNWDLGLHISADGSLEYKTSTTFGGVLQHRLVITEYSVGKDLVSVQLDSNGNAIAETQIAKGFFAPLGVAEDPNTGNLYVADLVGGGTSGQIDLLRPAVPSISVTPANTTFQGVVNAGATASKTVTITNLGGASLVIPASGITLAGTSPGQFSLTSVPTLPLTIPTGQSATVGIALVPTVAGPSSATLQIASNDPNNPTTTVKLSGLAFAGTTTTGGVGGPNEPSLQWVLQALGFSINTGTTNASSPTLPNGNTAIGDEVIIQRFEKATSAPVTVVPLAAFGPQDPVSGNDAIFGWYLAGQPKTTTPVFTVPNAYAQTLNPVVTGSTSFDPGNVSFGTYSNWPATGITAYQEDALNTFTESNSPHHVRVYPVKLANGTLVPNSYILAFEDSSTTSEYNGLVVEINNVQPAAGTISITNKDGYPSNTWYVFNRVGAVTATPPAGDAWHTTDTVQIANTGTDPLQITSLNITGPWALGSSITLPATITSGSSLAVPVVFDSQTSGISSGTLVVGSNDIVHPTTTLTLMGYWQSIPEGNPSQEPSVPTTAQIMGITTSIVNTGQSLNNGGTITTVGEEIISPYWQAENPAQPVYIREISAFHSQGRKVPFSWFTQGSPTTYNPIMTMDAQDSQSYLPRIYGLTGPCQATFTPTAPFGFFVDGISSDPAQNSGLDDAGPAPNGQHMLVYPVRDQFGNYVPYTYLMTMDYGGGNFDYNDNTWILTNVKPASPDPAIFVNPIIGTDVQTNATGQQNNPGSVFPGAVVPFGMVQLSPDTTYPAGGGYFYQSNFITGFSHTHLSGPGGPAYGDIPFMPTTGAITSTVPTTYGSQFVHTAETASPGYYSVSLLNYNTTVELTATKRTGWHRWTFPATTQANVMINVTGSLRGNVNGSVTIVDNQTVQGSSTSWGYEGSTSANNPIPYTVYFYAKFSQPFTAYGVWNTSGLQAGGTSASDTTAGAYVTFDTTTNQVIVAKVGISYTSLAEAQANLAAETSDFNFNNTAALARASWDTMLNKVEVAGGSPAQQQSFYTALYHTLLHPNLWSDADGSYLGFDGTVHQNATQPDYANFSLWDTYRTEHPLLALIDPSDDRDMMGSLMRIYNQAGWLPRWSYGNVETNNELTGDPSLPTLADAYAKGLLYDTPASVYAAMVNNANNTPPSSSQFTGRLFLSDYLTNGYVPYDATAGGVNLKLRYGTSTTLEYTEADGALSLMAAGLGKTSDQATYAARAHDYRNLFDPSTNYLRPLLGNDTFLTPFDPTSPSAGFKEGSAAQYTWDVPQDPAGLITLMGGASPAAANLDQFFAYSLLVTGQANVLNNVWQLGGYYNPSNEPDLGEPYDYNYVLQPWKTATVVHADESLYANTPQGIPGNDDLGEMSAWLVMSAIGLYPSMPGDPFYSITSPEFPNVTVHLDPNYYSSSALSIQAPTVDEGNIYIQSMALNGQNTQNTYLPHSTIQGGASIVYTVGASPSTTWGILPANAPPNPVP